MKKLDEDTQRLKKRYRLFLNKESKVLKQWLTWRGATLMFLCRPIKSMILQALLYAARKRFILACVHLLHNWQAYTGMQ